MKNLKWQRWGLATIALILLSFALGHFLLHSAPEQAELALPTPVPSAATPREEFFAPNASPSQGGTAANPQGTAPVSSEAFIKAVKACVPESPTREGQTVDQWMKQFLAQDAVKQSTFELENFHVQLPDGSIRRLHLLGADNTDNPGAVELRYFKLDQEGLPERIPLTDEQTHNPTPEFIQSLKKQGTVTLHQLKELQTLQDGSRLSLNLVNDQVFEFQLFRDKKTLSCRKMDCQCQ